MKSISVQFSHKIILKDHIKDLTKVLLVTPLWMQPRMQMAFWASSTYYWSTFTFSATSLSKFFYKGLLSIPSVLILYPCLESFWSRCSTLSNVVYLRLMIFSQAHFSSLSRSVWMPFLPSQVSTTSLNLVSSTILYRCIYGSLRDYTHHRSPPGHQAIDHPKCNQPSVIPYPVSLPEWFDNEIFGIAAAASSVYFLAVTLFG